MSLSKQAKINILTDIETSTPLAAGVLFPGIFYRNFDPIHKEIFDVLDCLPGQEGYRPRKCVIAPRGVGKTSTVEVLGVRAILLQKYDYIMVIGYNYTDAEEKTENMKTMLTQSELIKALYGDIKTDNWSKGEWVVKIAGKRIKIQPRGSGQPVRGRKFTQKTLQGLRASRPGLILVDDLEKSEETETEEQRQKKKTWFYGDVLNAIDRGAKHKPGEAAPWEIVVVGTILHHDSFLVNLHNSDNWLTTRLEICNDNFESNAPNFLSNEECKALYHEFKDDDEVDVWFREYRNRATPTGADAAFRPKYFRYYEESDENLNANPNVETVVIVDPSRTANPRSNPTGIVAVGVDVEDHKFYVRSCISERLHTDEMYDRIAETIVRYEAGLIAVEITGLHEFIQNPLKQFLGKRGISIPWMDLHARGGTNDEKGKQRRVRSLVDYYRDGVMYHNPLVCDVLEQQLQTFPRPEEWSVMDPLGYLPEILERGERFLSFPGKEEFESEKDVEREYRDLERMYAENGDWADPVHKELDFGVPI